MDTSQHKLGRYCNRIKSTHKFLFCILSAIHKLQNTNAGGPGTWWTSPGAEFTCYPKYLYYQTPVNQLWTQCNSCLYLYHNKLVGFVLHDKEHAHNAYNSSSRIVLSYNRLGTRGQFKVQTFGFDQFSQDFRLRLFSSKFLFSAILLWERNWWLLTFHFSSLS